MFTAATVDRAALLSALDVLQRVAPSRGTVPVMACVLVTVGGDSVRLSAFDCDTSLSVALSAYGVDGAGAVAVDCRTLRDLVRKTPRGSQIELRPDLESGRVALIAGRTRASVNYLPRDDFPALAPVDYAPAFVMGAKMLSRILSSVAPAFSDDPCRPYLGGAFVHCEAGRLAVAATNGHLLLRDLVDAPGAVASIQSTKPERGEAGFIVPASVVDLLARLVKAELATGSASVAPALDGSRLFMSAGAVTLEAKTVDGTFPDYRRIGPENGGAYPVGTWTVDGAAALAFYQAQPAPTGRAIQPGVAAAYFPGEAIETRTGGDGGATWSTAPGTYEGEAMTRGLQPRVAKPAFQFFADAGAVIVELFANPDSPLVLRALGKPGAIALAMPTKCAFEPAPSVADVVAPYEPAFPGMARDLSTVENGCQCPGATGPRVATAREVGTYLADLLERGGFPSHLKPVDPVAMLGRGVTYGAKLALAEGGAPGGADYVEGSFSLLIPGGRRNGESVILETLGDDGAPLKAQPLGMAPGKMTARGGGLSISPADVAAIVGPFEPVGVPAKRKSRAAPPVAPVQPLASVPAPVEPVAAPVEPVAAPVAVPDYVADYVAPLSGPFPCGPVEAAPVDLVPVPVEIAGSVARLVNWQAVDAMPDAAPGFTVEPCPSGPGYYVADNVNRCIAAGPFRDAAQAVAALSGADPVDPVAPAPVEPVDVQPVTVDPVTVEQVEAPDVDGASFAARLARIEAALGLVQPQPVAKRSPSHARAVRIAWRNRSALAEARDERAAALYRADKLETELRHADGRAAQAVATAERALAERNAARLESGERAELVAAVDAARVEASQLRSALEAARYDHARNLSGRRRIASRARALRRDVKASRAMADGLAVNLQAMTRRAVDDAASVAALRERVANLTGEQAQAPRPSFIMSSR